MLTQNPRCCAKCAFPKKYRAGLPWGQFSGPWLFSTAEARASKSSSSPKKYSHSKAFKDIEPKKKKTQPAGVHQKKRRKKSWSKKSCYVWWFGGPWLGPGRPLKTAKKMAIARQTHATACSSCSPSAVRTWVVRGPRRLCHYFLFVCLWLLGFLTNKKFIGTIGESTRRSSTTNGAERTAGVAAPKPRASRVRSRRGEARLAQHAEHADVEETRREKRRRRRAQGPRRQRTKARERGLRWGSASRIVRGTCLARRH